MASKMPSNFKQKNKPFKGSTKQKNKKHKGEVNYFKQIKATKKIKKKVKNETKADRKNKNSQIKVQKEKKQPENMLNENIFLTLEQVNSLKNIQNKEKAPKIIAFIPMNQQADTLKILNEIYKIFEGCFININKNIEKNTHIFPYLIMQSNSKKFPELKKENYIFIACDRDSENSLDILKVADIFVPVLSCKDCDYEKANLDPFKYGQAFDKQGYDFLSCARAQGLPTILKLLTDINQIPQKKQGQVKHLFKRFFNSEFGEEEKFFSLENENDILVFLRTIESLIVINKQQWREERGYMLAQKIECSKNENLIEIYGFVKGQGFGPDNLVHITGFDDFQVKQIDILTSPFYKNENEEEKIVLSAKPSENIESLKLIAENENKINKIIEEEEELEIKEKHKINDMEIEEMDEKENFEGDSDISFNEQDYNPENMIEEKKQLKFEMQKRTQDDLEFEDEVDYSNTISLKERYAKYKGLKNLKNSEWDLKENLPDEYEKIFIFDNFIQTKKKSIEKSKKNIFVPCGFWVKLTIENFPIDKISPNKPFIVSSMHFHERKLTQVHFKVKKTLDFEKIEFFSKESYRFQIGFKKLNAIPLFSQMFNNCQKTKYLKSIKSNNYFMCSLYFQTMIVSAPVLIFKNIEGSDSLVLSGEFVKNDPLHPIIKRIILTGYPSKINKRRAIVKLMFFNTKDIKYFQPIELFTKLGLKGKILQSLGTHGLMKCGFSSFIKAHDTVCLPLYKRVFPKFPQNLI